MWMMIDRGDLSSHATTTRRIWFRLLLLWFFFFFSFHIRFEIRKRSAEWTAEARMMHLKQRPNAFVMVCM
jgi:hypothetical protein